MGGEGPKVTLSFAVSMLPSSPNESALRFLVVSRVWCQKVPCAFLTGRGVHSIRGRSGRSVLLHERRQDLTVRSVSVLLRTYGCWSHWPDIACEMALALVVFRIVGRD